MERPIYIYDLQPAFTCPLTPIYGGFGGWAKPLHPLCKLRLLIIVNLDIYNYYYEYDDL